ncbi:unnamed protein product [Parascedosporium putredinis]|uniref:Zn(2)-C6 fungal-type domain-containing protein n=1 Tax=Parascedosporium putredinis TaxID=1442378 RepID=A0A9P1MCE9_9PEZI|nr:unnamed protein product [Parascedosporium putredinis]CAI7998277.1 unnamed protein product [Parascedosporium putredinis]
MDKGLGADPITPPSPPTAKGVIKRRACDECRTRKLACSKEPDGCLRCRREGLACVYSAQKPMGRPKKRRQSELDFSEGVDRADFWPENHDAPLPAATSQLATLHTTTTMSSPVTRPKAEKESVHRIFQVIARFLFTQQISCDGIPDPELAAAAGPDISDAQKLSARLASHPNVTCPCLSSVYLALDSLNNIAADIPAAICTARATAKIAHENTMLLSTLLASLSNAYSRLLDTIDIAAAEARDAGTMLRFSFRPLGSVWSDLGSDSSASGGGGGGGECLLSLVINESDLNPDVWRLAMRAVLRYEIYGFNLDPPPPSLCATDELTVPEHLGLAQAALIILMLYDDVG